MGGKSKATFAMLALGLCLASTESRLYTAVYAYNGRTVSVMLASVAVLVVTYGTGILASRRHVSTTPLLGLFAVLTALQEVSIVAQNPEVSQWLPAGALPLCMSLGECYSAGFVVLLILVMFVKSSQPIRTFIGAFALAGAVQLVFAVFRAELAAVLIPLLPVASLLLAVLSLRKVSDDGASIPSSGSLESIGKGREAAAEWTRFKGGKAALLLLVFVMAVLLVATHASRMSYQDGASMSVVVQMVNGASGIVVAGVLLALNQRISGAARVVLSLLLALTVLLGALYVASLVQNAVMLVVLTAFHKLAYGLLYYFILSLCLASFSLELRPARLLVCFFTMRSGWAAGVFAFITLPPLMGSGVSNAALIISFVAMVALDAFVFVNMLRFVDASQLGAAALPRLVEQPRSLGSSEVCSSAGFQDEAPSKSPTSQAVSSAPTAPTTESAVPASPPPDGYAQRFKEACKNVAERYGLTRRETEVLALLAKGRTGAYIRGKLFISEGTVRTHTDHIYKKLGIHSQQELIDIVEATEAEENR